MARVLQKRKRSNGFVTSKRRRFVRRRRFGRGRRALGSMAKSTQWTSQGFLPRPLMFKSRRMRGRAWRRHLWRDTLSASHWRSAFSNRIVATTGAVEGQSAIFAAPALKDVDGNAFWLSPMTRPINEGGAVPTFIGDITLRGGLIKMIASAPTDFADIVMFRVWLIFTKSDPKDKLPASATSWAVDPMTEADFATTTGKVLLYRENMINNDNQSMKVEYRLRPQKIDPDVFGPSLEPELTDSGGQYVWLFQIINMTSSTNQTVNIHYAWNVSFSADALEPPA